MKFRVPQLLHLFQSNRKTRPDDASPPQLQALESRTLLSVSPNVTSIIADNRGQVILTTDVALKASTVNRNTVLMFTAGADHKFHTADDVVQHPTIVLNGKQIKITGNIDYRTPYRVALLGSKITDAAGHKLDGEFNGAGTASGNGVAGGNFDVVIKAASTKVVRFTTYAGIFNVTLSSDPALAITVNNYLKHVNLKDYDNTFAQRRSQPSEGIDVIQAGKYKVLDNTHILTNPTRGTIKLHAGVNVAGTLAMARGNAANSGSNEFFFNVTDNPLLNVHTGQEGYSVFGQTDAHGQAVLNKINAYKLVNAGGPLSTLPVHDFAVVVKRKVLDYVKDTIIFGRVAVLSDVVSTASVKTTKF